jgi:hypothetical protein
MNNDTKRTIAHALSDVVALVKAKHVRFAHALNMFTFLQHAPVDNRFIIDVVIGIFMNGLQKQFQLLGLNDNDVTAKVFSVSVVFI